MAYRVGVDYWEPLSQAWVPTANPREVAASVFGIGETEWTREPGELRVTGHLPTEFPRVRYRINPRGKFRLTWWLEETD